MFTELKVGDHVYKLKLTTRGIVQLEKDLGCSPLQMFMGIDEDVLPKVGDMIKVLHRMLQPYNHGISTDDTYDIFDDYIDDGHTTWDLIPILLEVFQDAGFLPKEEGEPDSKN